jgi:hypothetical protein
MIENLKNIKCSILEIITQSAEEYAIMLGELGKI